MDRSAKRPSGLHTSSALWLTAEPSGAVNEDDGLWTPRELAKFLPYSETTICRMVSQSPEKLPPRVAALARPRWLPELAREWAKESSDLPIGRGGRPRKTR